MPNWLFLAVYTVVICIPSIIAVFYVIKTPKDRLRTFPFLKVDPQLFWITFSIVGTFVGAIITLFVARAPIPVYERDEMKRQAKAEKEKRSDSE